MNPVDTTTLLNRLIVTSKDGELALRAAAMESHHADVKEALFDYSAFFRDAAVELQSMARKYGQHPREIGTFANTLHRTWMHVRARAVGRDEHVILDDIESDEALADQLYGDAPNWDLPDDVRTLLARQGQEAFRHHQRIRELKEHLPA